MLKQIKEYLENAKRYGLEVEVVISSLERIKENPLVTPIQAIEYGCQLWNVNPIPPDVRILSITSDEDKKIIIKEFHRLKNEMILSGK